MGKNLTLIFFFLIGFSLSVKAQQKILAVSEQELIRQKIEETSKAIKSIQSNFEQIKHLSFLDKDIKSYGNLIFKAPDRIKWEYKKPFLYSVVFKYQKLFINDSGNKSEVDVGANKAFQSLNAMIVKSVSGNLFDEAEFSFEFYENPDSYEVRFTPKNSSLKQFIDMLILHFDKKNFQVVRIKMMEGASDFTLIRFFDQQINIPVNDAVFTN